MIYLAGYDVESERCLEGVRAIAARHREARAPATFFLLGELLEEEGWSKALAETIDDPLFDIQSHTWSHIRLKPAGPEWTKDELEEIDRELRRTNELIALRFGRRTTGLRSPCGFEDGLGGDAVLQRLIWRTGIRFVSSRLMGRGGTVPAPLARPYFYEEDDILRPLLELPAHDWHDNVLKGYNFCPVGWPPNVPWGYPDRPPQTPAEEFAVYRMGLEYALEKDFPYYGPCMHPWSIHRFNAGAETVGLILDHVRVLGLEVCHYREIHERIRRGEIPVVHQTNQTGGVSR